VTSLQVGILDDVRRRARISVPGGLFAGSRRLPLTLFDADDIEVTPGISVRGRDDVFVATSDLPALRHYLEQHQLLQSEAIDPANRAWALHRLLTWEAADLFSALGGRLTLLPLARLARELAQFQTQHRQSFHFLPLIVSEEYTPVSHAVETALYSVALAAAAGVRGIEALAALALGGVFADAGKLLLPAELLSREGPLSDLEWQQMKDHPHASVSLLRRAVGAVPQGTILGIATHHERWNGSGYPDGLTASEIPYEGRILAIADAFGAMTVNRAYRGRVQPFDALSEMARLQGQFDPNLLRTFVLLLASSQAEATEDESVEDESEASASAHEESLELDTEETLLEEAVEDEPAAEAPDPRLEEEAAEELGAA
jgi:HD-GYP domain-containing protein (c-di-GMP phosphodiesterase class II)